MNLKGGMAETSNLCESDSSRHRKSFRYQNGALFVSSGDYSCAWVVMAVLLIIYLSRVNQINSDTLSS
jgi:hypothetical protein